MYDKLNYLASLMAPDYTNGFMRGNLIQLTIGNYLVGVTGILTALNYAVQPNYSWDIGMDKDGKRISKVLPTLIDVSSFGFTPIHNFVPQKGAPFINNSPNEFTSTQTQ